MTTEAALSQIVWQWGSVNRFQVSRIYVDDSVPGFSRVSFEHCFGLQIDAREEEHPSMKHSDSESMLHSSYSLYVEVLCTYHLRIYTAWSDQLAVGVL